MRRTILFVHIDGQTAFDQGFSLGEESNVQVTLVASVRTHVEEVEAPFTMPVPRA